MLPVHVLVEPLLGGERLAAVAALEEVRRGYVAGDILSGELKQMTIDKAATWLSELAEMRDQNAHLVNEFLADDTR